MMQNKFVLLQSLILIAMARLARQQSGTGIYHVMLRGINRQNIFEDDEDFQHMVGSLYALCHRFDEDGNRLPALCTFYAYCIMSNHVHLLLQEKEESIGQTVKRLGVSYSYYYNKKYDRCGHLFQDRFRSEPVNDLSYFVVLLRYIHQNPVKAGLVSSPVDYPWSSWREYECPSPHIVHVCNTDTVLKRIPYQRLKEYVDIPVEEGYQIIDVDNDMRLKLSDSTLCHILRDNLGIASPTEVQALDKNQRDVVLEKLLTCGGGIRQISRITGVSFGIVQKIKKRMI